MMEAVYRRFPKHERICCSSGPFAFWQKQGVSLPPKFAFLSARPRPTRSEEMHCLFAVVGFV